MTKRRPLLSKITQLWLVNYVFLFIATSQFSFSFGFFERFIEWFGMAILGLEKVEKIHRTGSGDTLYDYVVIICCVIFSLIIAMAVSAIKRRKDNFDELYQFTIVIVRYFVAYTMVVYGFAKVFEGQFASPGYFRLEQKVGDMSPMGLVWTFMGVSRSYTVVSGLLELTGGVLLFWRRTKTLGALFSMIVMLNVAFLNFFYDVPVKIFSSHIIFLCLFILSYDLKPLIDFFVFHRPTRLPYALYRPQKRWKLVTTRVIKYAFICGSIVLSCVQMWYTLKKERVPHEGAYLIDTFVLDGDSILQHRPETDTLGWSKILISSNHHFNYLDNAGNRKYLQMKTDTLTKTISLYRNGKHAGGLVYSFQQDSATFTGRFEGRDIYIKSLRKQKNDYSLINRGFHWINDYPPNW
ncbi:hypothetical protein SAMN05660226_03223 [Parapedobacter luteus]|uniref:DoxX protein n=1 Tax=Parapedobacter luteus TaxID=623280 RepID=A0A1T5EBH4_9SPHI|nr:hypothetical protein [Parapedobacter luteus]SKB81170.1 hypothetical protein SAMN05660226_03223 [Parapedobacter luteus]